MIDLNLLPWRAGLYQDKLKRIIIVFLGVLCIFLAILMVYRHQLQQRLYTQTQHTRQLQQKLIHLQALNRQQFLELQHQNQRSLNRVKPIESSHPSRQLELMHVRILPIHYAKATDLANIIKDKTNALLSRRGRIAVDQRSNVLWLEDTANHLQKLQKFVHYFDIPAQQIVIEARIVNMNQEAARDLGIRLGLLTPQRMEGNTNSVPGPHLGLDIAAKPIEAAAATLGLTQALLTSQRLLDVELSALESQGKAKVIASPRLVTSNQIAAVIEAGEDIPYQEFTTNGVTSVAFKKAVLRLQVVPQITAKHELMMALLINQDADSGKRVQGVPIITTKSIETHILVRHGDTIVLGGIYQQDRNHHTDQIPFLGDLPWVGDLFQRKHLQVRHEALLIFITPRIVDH